MKDRVFELCDIVRATDIEHGLLINFGAPKFFVKKYAMTSGKHP